MLLYGRRIVLRNCGRFLHVASDYGSMYTTHAHVSSEMLYVGLSRERTRLAHDFTSLAKRYDFFEDFDLARWPVWFTPATLINHDGQFVAKSRTFADVHQFNSMQEGTPGIQDNDKLPKFGSMETILPDKRFACIAVSSHIDLLAGIEPGQVYWMGKKRTMFEIMVAGDITALEQQDGACQTPFLQVGPRDASHFTRLHVLATTQRYILLSGLTKASSYWRLPAQDDQGHAYGIPQFALDNILTQFQREARA